MPERFQLRRIPICPADDPEIKEEAQWIFKHAFTTAPLSQQDYYDGGVDPVEERPKRPASTVGKICDALNFMRNQQFEVCLIDSILNYFELYIVSNKLGLLPI